MSLPALMEKYDPVAVLDDLENLNEEIQDEVDLEKSLCQDSATKTAKVLSFIANNKEIIQEQHDQMVKGYQCLDEKIKHNMALEADDAAYMAAISSDDAKLVAQLLLEMNAVADKYKELLNRTGRVGRPPVLPK